MDQADQYGERGVMPIECFGIDGGREVDYCGVKCKMVSKPEEYLRHLFGDWHKLPPLVERVPKHAEDGAWFYSEEKKCGL